jgi:uncharacterized protein YuzE
MKIEFDKQADALYIHLQEKTVAKTKEVEEGILLDFDEDNRLIGLEILDVTKRFALADIVNLQVENLPVEIATG